MGAFDVESSKYVKLPKAFVVEGGKYVKLPKAFVVEGGKYVKLWSAGGDVKPYMIYHYYNTKYYSIGCTSDKFESMPGTCSATAASVHGGYNITRMTYFNDKYFTADSNGGICYSADGATYTKLLDSKTTDINGTWYYTNPKLAGDKLCFANQRSAGDAAFRILFIERDLSYSTVHVSYPSTVSTAYAFINDSLFYSKATGKYYGIVSSSNISGSQYGSGGGGEFRMLSIDPSAASVTATDLGVISKWSFTASSSVNTGYQDVYVNQFEQDGKLLIFNRHTVQLFDPVTNIFKCVYENDQPTNNNTRIKAVYRISEKDFIGFSDAYTYSLSYNSEVVTKTYSSNKRSFAGYLRYASSNSYLVYAYPGDGGTSYASCCGGVGYNGVFYYATFHKKDNKPKMILHYSLDKGVTWTQNGTQDNALTLSNTTGISDTNGAIRFSTSVETENEVIVDK